MLWFRQCTLFISLIALLVGAGQIATAGNLAGQIAETNPTLKADSIVVVKSDRRLTLMRQGQVLQSYAIALGGQPLGQKVREGDRRTPEGQYQINWRNPDSTFHLSLHISYPGPLDLERARSLGVEPGSMIMIHGLPNGLTAKQIGHPKIDWTHGCIAVTNEEIEEIWKLVDDGTPVIIRP